MGCIVNFTKDELDIIANALEMWIGNEHDDIHEMSDDDEGRGERQTRVALAELLHARISREVES